MEGMMADRQAQMTRNSPAGALWLIQAFSGVLLIPLLLLHMVAHHFVVEGGLRNFQQVIDYVSNPAIFVITIIFLIVVTIHAMLGLRAIIMDLNLSQGTQRVVDWILIVVSIGAIVYGIWLEITIVNL